MAKTEAKTYDLPYVDVFNEVQYAMQACGFRIEMADFNSGYLKATTGISMTSYGETIEVNLGQVAGGTQVLVSSRPSHYFTDMGKSKANVRKLFGYMDSRIGGFITGGPGSPVTDAGYRGGGPQFSVTMSEPSRTGAVVLITINAIITMLLAVYYFTLLPFLGVFMLIPVILLFFGLILVSMDHCKAGAVCAIIGGVITVPLGILGIIGGSKAWERGKWLDVTGNQMMAYDY
jgi:hypothetical protein